MPRLWNETIEAHHRTVRDAILDATAALATERGPLAVTMSQVAQEAGIGRATLYKYFPDVRSILLAWHNRQITAHLDELTRARDNADGPGRLEAVLDAYARIHHERAHRHRKDRYRAELGPLLHGDEQADSTERRIHAMIRDLLHEAAADGRVRSDLTPEELAGYCRHALHAAGDLPSAAAVRRLVAVVLDGMRIATD